MNTTLWIIASVLSVAFLAGGIAQLSLDRATYRNLAASQHWADDFGPGHIKAIGTLKVIGALGLTLPALLDIATVLVPLAACGLALVMAGAATTRFRRSEWTFMIGDVMFLTLFGFVAWGRFDLAPFA